MGLNRIMVIEDNENIRNELIGFLLKYNYDAYGYSDFDNIINNIFKDSPDLILLDINLPYYDGYYICREIRKQSNIPIIVVTSRDSETDELMSMNLGADDFITKPYNLQILLARIESVLRRVYGKCDNLRLKYNGLVVDIDNSIMTYEDNIIDLTKNELKILTCLIRNKDKIVSRDKLMDFMWSSDLYVDDNTLSVNITRVRKKLQNIGVGDIIETKRGVGYKII